MFFSSWLRTRTRPGASEARRTSRPTRRQATFRPRLEVLEGHRRALHEAGIGCGDSRQFLRWFDLMGLQRHIKVLGIFARLYYRDGKSQYLFDLPLVFRYAREAAAMYEELKPLAELFGEIAPRFEAAQGRIKV